MDQYKINITRRGKTLVVLLIPFSTNATLLSLVNEIRRRASRIQLILPGPENISLRLKGENGILLDHQDLIRNVVLNPKVDVINADYKEQGDQVAIGGTARSPAPETFKIRVITPHLARRYADRDDIPAIIKDSVTTRTSLGQIRSLIQGHLGLDFENFVPFYEECNCRAAKQIYENASVNDDATADDDDTDPSLKLIVVSGASSVVLLNLEADEEDAEDGSILGLLRRKYGDTLDSKKIILVGGTSSSDTLWGYAKLPVVAICSKSRHLAKDQSARGSGYRQTSKCIDLHTAECPIAISDVNFNETLGELYLDDLAINGIINLYVVERTMNLRGMEEPGPQDVFMNDEAWHPTIKQSEHGMAAMLSTLRIVSHFSSGDKMDKQSRDAILHTIYSLTRFPPAVRAFYTLMSGSLPQRSDQAVLSQTIFEILQEVAPPQIVQSNPQRCLEWARILFGLVLEKSKQIKRLDAHAQPPYLSTLRFLDLRSPHTLESMPNPVMTSSGLMENGFFEALREGGLIRRRLAKQQLSLSPKPIDSREKRRRLLSGALFGEIMIFDFESIRHDHYSSSRHAIISSRELSDLGQMSTFASQNQLSVIPITGLRSQDAPVLTLDSQGLLSVYVGLAPQAATGKDITIFRPMANGEEIIDETTFIHRLDTSRRQGEMAATSTVLPDAPQEGQRLKYPEEVVVVVLDCSRSMNDDSGFVELDVNEAPNKITPAEEFQAKAEDRWNFTHRVRAASLPEMKSHLRCHESLDDIIATIQEVPKEMRRDVAIKFLKVWTALVSDRITSDREAFEKEKKKQDIICQRNYKQNSRYYMDLAIAKRQYESKIVVNGLNSHLEALCDFLIYRAANSEPIDKAWEWKSHDAIPAYKYRFVKFEPHPVVPSYLLCPISQTLIEDPVIAEDGNAYERKNIQRWFDQVGHSSPETGSPLKNLELNASLDLTQRIQIWISGSKYIREQQPQKSLFRSSKDRQVTFKTNLDPFFSRNVPPTFSISCLYQLAYRGLKAKHRYLQLNFKHQLLEPHRGTISSEGIKDGSIIHIHYPEDGAFTSHKTEIRREEDNDYLIKVYNDYDTSYFAYWYSMYGRKSVASVIFRAWRYYFTKDPMQPIRHLNVGLVSDDDGDSHRGGLHLNHWTELWYKLTTQTTQILEQCKGNLFGPRFVQLCVGTRTLRLEGDEDECHNNGKLISRLDFFKIMINSFIDRMLAFELQPHIGLITCQTTASISHKITPAFDDLSAKANSTKAHGDTALWDALWLAGEQIMEYSKRFPKAKRRIICFSDGHDNKSEKKSSEIASYLVANKIMLDSISIGSEDNTDLQKLSHVSGGYGFAPKFMGQAFEICEMDSVLSSLERPDPVLPDCSDFDAYFQSRATSQQKAISEVYNPQIFPQRKKHRNLDDSFVLISSAASDAQTAGPANSHSNDNLLDSRIQTEVRHILANSNAHYDVYLSESKMSFWKVIMQGPPESAYSAGTFVLYIDMEQSYPNCPPKCRFVTPIHHPSISPNGRICHKILGRRWNSTTTNHRLIDTIYSLLLDPDYSEHINSVITLDFLRDQVGFNEQVRLHIQKHATKTREEWKAEIQCEE